MGSTIVQERVIDNTLSDQLAARVGAVRSRLRVATQPLHTRAERSGIVGELLAGRASQDAYALYLRSLLPAYQALESGLAKAPDTSPLHALADSTLYRADALAADLAVLIGRDWSAQLPLVPAASTYATAITQAATTDPVDLAAHAYVRYMGDLSGGQIVRTMLRRTLAIPDEALAFYRFDDPTGLKQRVAHVLARLATDEARLERLAAVACFAFEFNIALSEAVAKASSQPG